MRFAGRYDQARALYERLLDGISADSLRIAGPVRERYIRFGAAQSGYSLPRQMIANNVAEYDTELQVPVASA